MSQISNMSNDFVEFTESQLFGLPDNYKFLLDKETIQTLVNKCAVAIHDYFNKCATDKNTKCEIVLLRILNGGSYFGGDLARCIQNIIRKEGTSNKISLSDEFITASSYEGEQTAKSLVIMSQLNINKFFGKKIILIDELLDKGETIKQLIDFLVNLGIDANNIFSCVAFMKDKERVIEPTWFGIIVPDIWLIGYGLDDRQNYRELEIVCYVSKPPNIEQTCDDKVFCVENYHQVVFDYLEQVKKYLASN